jgi:hypothetical protein
MRKGVRLAAAILTALWARVAVAQTGDDAGTLDAEVREMLDRVGRLRWGLDEVPRETLSEVASIRAIVERKQAEFLPIIRGYLAVPEELKAMAADSDLLKRVPPGLAAKLKRQNAAIWLIGFMDQERAGRLYREMFVDLERAFVPLEHETTALLKRLREVERSDEPWRAGGIRERLRAVTPNHSFILGRMSQMVRACARIGSRELVIPVLEFYESGFDDQDGSVWEQYVLSGPENAGMSARVQRLVADPYTADAVRLQFERALRARRTPTDPNAVRPTANGGAAAGAQTLPAMGTPADVLRSLVQLEPGWPGEHESLYREVRTHADVYAPLVAAIFKVPDRPEDIDAPGPELEKRLEAQRALHGHGLIPMLVN